MGGLFSYLGMGGAGGRLGEGGLQEEQQVFDLSLLDMVNPEHQGDDSRLQWVRRMTGRLETHPEEAAAYARGIDPSPLYRAMQLAHSRYDTVLPVDLVRLFVESYEEVVFDVPLSGETLLFVATYGASLDIVDNNEDTVSNNNNNRKDALEIVKLLMEYNPDAVSQATTQSKMLPLHHLRSDPELAVLLLNAYPQASVEKDVAGRLALHHCCSGNHVRGLLLTRNDNDNRNDENEADDDDANVDHPTAAEDNMADALRLALAHANVVTELIRAAKEQGLTDGGVLTPDVTKKTPLDLLSEEIEGELDECKELKNSADSLSRVGRLWESFEIMVRSISSTTDDDGDEPFRMVHAVIALNCSPAIVAHALKLHPEQLAQRDAKGCTPLMLAALSLDKVHPSVICTLLQCYPEAACMTDADGRLPIDIIAEGKKYDEELFKSLVKAEPRAIDTRDLRDKMFPFMTAAIGEKSNVNSTFRLLRAKPHVLSYFNLE